MALQAKLERGKHPIDEDRSVRSLAEARFAGSRTAWFLEEIIQAKGELARLEKIQVAEQERAAADRKLQELQAVKK